MEQGHFNKHFFKNTRKKKWSQGKIEEIFLLDTVKNYISNKTFNQNLDTIRLFFPKLGHFFQFPFILF